MLNREFHRSLLKKIYKKGNIKLYLLLVDGKSRNQNLIRFRRLGQVPEKNVSTNVRRGQVFPTYKMKAYSRDSQDLQAVDQESTDILERWPVS